MFLVDFEEEWGKLHPSVSYKISKTDEEVKSKINLYCSDLDILVIRMLLETSHFLKIDGEMLGV